MTERLIPYLYLLTCAPLVAAGGAWLKLYRARQLRALRPVALLALAVLTLNSALGAATFLYYELNPSPAGPPWDDPEVLGVLLFLAPIGMFIGLFADPTQQEWLDGIHNGPKLAYAAAQCVQPLAGSEPQY